MGSVDTSSEPFDPSDPERLVPYLRSLWSRRAYATYVATSDLRDRQVTSALGNLWYLLNPALQILVYFIIFGVIVTGVRDGIDNYILFLTVGVLLFTTVQRSIITGSTSVVRNRGLIQSFNFPRALLPLTSCIAEFLASLPAVLVMLVVALLTGESIAMQWLAIIPIIVSLFILNLGLALLAARVTTYFRDFDQILPFVLRLLLYLSGVLFSV
jgi:teichoic acid transport system permease protein